MTQELARGRRMVVAEEAPAETIGRQGGNMTTISCPWCAVELRFEPSQLEGSEASCGDCSSTWLLGDVIEELALAA